MTTVQPGYGQQGYGQPGYGQPAYGQPAMQQTTMVVGAPQPMVIVAESKPDTHLCMAIFTCLCCCPLISLPSIIFACMVDSRWDAGDREGAKSASRTAATLWKVSLGLGIAWIILVCIIVPVYFLVILPTTIINAAVG